jgi:beta-lactamase superfamily II metal-dependent hydrolase
MLVDRRYVQKSLDFFRKLTRLKPAPPEARLHLYALPANSGDALVVQYKGEDEKNHFIWIDGGLVKSYQQTKTVMQAITGHDENIDLLVVTHVDQDHIGGILAFAADPEAPHDRVRQYWFNASRNLAQYFNTRHHPDRELTIPQQGLRSIDQGIKLESFLQREGKWHNEPIKRFQMADMQGMGVFVLGPDEEDLRKLAERWSDEMRTEPQDRSIDWSEKKRESLEALAQKPFVEDDSRPNGSSIVLALEYEGFRLLLPGDAHPSDLVTSLQALGYSKDRPMVLDAFKLSHHGSKGSISTELLDLIDCRNYVVSTDASRHGLPHREALARIILHPRNKQRGTAFYFNYNNDTLQALFTPGEIKKYRIRCIFPENEALGAVIAF